MCELLVKVFHLRVIVGEVSVMYPNLVIKDLGEGGGVVATHEHDGLGWGVVWVFQFEDSEELQHIRIARPLLSLPHADMGVTFDVVSLPCHL